MVRLLDAYGNPVRKGTLGERQAEPAQTGVRSPFAEPRAAGLTPDRLAAILRACDRGDITSYVTLAEEIEERDLHYFSVLGVRKRAVSGVVPRVEPAGKDARSKEIAEAVTERIAEHDGFSDLVEDMLDAVGKGFSLVEIDWGRSSDQWWPNEFIHVDPRFVRFDRDTGREMRLIDERDMMDGVPLKPFGFIRHRAKLKSGLAFRGGIARVASFSFLCKNYSVKDWTAFAELFGMPLRVGRYSASATPEDIRALYRAVANIGTDAAAILPEGMPLEFIERKSQGGEKVFEGLARYVDEQLSKAVLGQTMTSDNGSSQSQAEVHNEVRHDIAQADARAVTSSLNRDLVRPFVDLNFGRPADGKYPRLIIHVEAVEDTKSIIEGVERMAKLGVKFSQQAIRQRLGFDDPEGGEDVIGGAPAPKDPTAAPASGETETSEDTAANRAGGGSPWWDELDEIEARMGDQWQDVTGPMTDPIDRAIEASSSFEEALERLTAAYPEMAEGELINRLVTGMVKARGLGDARDE